MPDKKPTLQLVADMAGVSRGTVDRVLKNRPHVRPEVYERVSQALRESGYLSYKRILPPSDPEERDSALVIGVLRPAWPGQFQKEVTEGIREAEALLADSGVRVVEKVCDDEIPAAYVSLLQEMEAEGVQGLSVCTMNDPAVRDELNRLIQKGIPVITFNSDIPSSARTCFIGQDYRKSGRLAGELLSKTISPGTPVLAALGNYEFQGHRERLEGFLARFEENGFPASSVQVIETHNSYEIAFRKITDAFTENPGIRAIYMANSGTNGCIQALRNLHVPEWPHIVCHDLSDFKKSFLLQHEIDFVISQDLQMQGREPLLMLRDYLLKGEPAMPPAPSQLMSIYCSENIL